MTTARYDTVGQCRVLPFLVISCSSVLKKKILGIRAITAALEVEMYEQLIEKKPGMRQTTTPSCQMVDNKEHKGRKKQFEFRVHFVVLLVFVFSCACLRLTAREPGTRILQNDIAFAPELFLNCVHLAELNTTEYKSYNDF